MNYSIHTYELSARINFNEFFEIYESLKEFKPSIQKEHRSCFSANVRQTVYHFRQLDGAYGIDCITLNKIDSGPAMLEADISFIINPYNTVNMQKHSDAHIVDAECLSASTIYIIGILEKILPINVMRRIELSRVDFCTNLKFQTQQQAEEYISLLHLGIPPKVLKERRIFDTTQRRYIPYKYAILLECGDYSVEIYSKYKQMENRFPSASVEAAKGMVRIELRANIEKIFRLMQRYNFPRMNVFEFLSEHYACRIYSEELPGIIASMVGNGNFVPYNDIIQRIEHSDFQDRTKKKMAAVCAYFSGRKYSNRFLSDSDLTHKDWKNILNKFNHIQCSPIPVPPTFSLQKYPGVASWDPAFS